MNSSFKIFIIDSHFRKSPYIQHLCITTKNQPLENKQPKIFNAEGLRLLNHAIDTRLVKNNIQSSFNLIDINMMLFPTYEYIFCIS